MSKKLIKEPQLYIFESLNDSKLTGLNLIESIENEFQENYPQYGIIDSKSDFISELNKLKDVITINDRPIIHLEAHGVEGGTGVCFKDESIADWSELIPHFSHLNLLCDDELIICASLCHGFDLYRYGILRDKRCCRALIAPDTKVKPGYLLRTNIEFYKTLLATNDFRVASEAAFKVFDPNHLDNHFVSIYFDD